jgi:signal transduction histidine kinase
LREAIEAFNEMTTALRMQRAAQLAYLGGVAHDLRNPLSAVSMALELVRTEPSEEQRANAVELVDRQVARLARMVGDLLDATRIEAGQLELHTTPVELRALCREVVDLYRATARGQEIAVRAPEEPVVVDADPLRVEQVIGNLVSNAIKYSPRGGPIDVVVRGDAAHAVLEVSDRGIGMSREQIADLFVPFRRSAKDVAPGVGLGLSVVLRIVRAHGGSIEVESELGAGSTFRVTLPLARRDHAGG